MPTLGRVQQVRAKNNRHYIPVAVEIPMNTWIALPFILIAACLFAAGHYNWIPKGWPKAISRVVTVLFVIVALAIFTSPFRELGK
jgi:hypothetical protein